MLTPAVVAEYPAELPAKKFRHTDLRTSLADFVKTDGTNAIVLKQQIGGPVPHDCCTIG